MKKRILFGVTFFVGIFLLTISLKNDVHAKLTPLTPEIRCENGALSCTSALDYCILDDCSVWAGWKE
ncbi:MAG: hypothetical protein ACP5DQ_11095 [Bacteroidales bacterium]